MKSLRLEILRHQYSSKWGCPEELNKSLTFVAVGIKCLLSILCAWGLSACSLDATIFNKDLLSVDVEPQEHRTADFIYGEVVTTYGGVPGYEVKAVFGEISEKTETLNGNKWQIEGVFYE